MASGVGYLLKPSGGKNTLGAHVSKRTLARVSTKGTALVVLSIFTGNPFKSIARSSSKPAVEPSSIRARTRVDSQG